ncbi:MAG: aldose 1-epimerase family protein, partial [Thomasclavelia sp.]
GGHPAFACPFRVGESSNDYYLEFSDNETLARKVLNLKKKGISHETVSFLDNEKRFFVRQELFSNDTIVLENFKSNKMALKSLNHNKSLVVHMDGFTHLGIWAAKHVGGLIAIEPWFGHSDYDDFCGEFKDKEGIVSLKENEQFEATFKIEINQ